jgi:PmbA protein
MSEDRLLEQAVGAVDAALAAGADDAVAAVSKRRGLHFKWRDGSLEDVKEDAARGLAVSLYVDGRYSTHTTNDLDPERLRAFIGEAVALTRHLQPDPYREIPDPKLYEGRSEQDLDLLDPAVIEMSRDARIGDCRTMEEAARADESVISATTHVQDAHALSARASSNGFRGTEASTSAAFVATVTAREGETKRPEDHWFVAGTHLEGLPDREAVGREALRRVLARRGARKVSSRKTTLVLHPEAGAMLLGRMFPALTAGAIQQKRSFLAECRGKAVASPALTIRDDPLVVRGLGSRHYDGEGLAASTRTVIEKGVLETFFVDTYYGKKLGWTPTSGSPSNLVFDLGEKDLQGIVAHVTDGLLVTSFIGGNANLTSGDYSYGVRGHLVEDGEITRPISEMNVTGNYLDLLQRLVLVGNDPAPYFTCQTPTLVFDGVQFSGS